MMIRLFAILLGLWVPTFVFAVGPPAQTLDLTRWMLTLPIDTDHAGQPDEILQPELATFSNTRYFFVNEAASAVIFRAHCGGSTTKGSKFPRCELREMDPRQDLRAGWSTDDSALRSMTLRVAINKTPSVKKHVVCAQIHDREDDLMMIRLEGSKLFIERNSVGDVMLDRDYRLGTPVELKIQAGGGQVKVWYEGQLRMKWKVSRSGCYFKAGCYTQSNLSKGDAADAFGEVAIYQLSVDSDL